MTEQQKLRELLENSSHIVFFGGAGVSTIPDFRSEDGLYGSKQAKTYPYPPETMLSHSFFKRHTEQFFEYYFDRMVYPQAKPNAAHYALAELEAQGKLSAVVTQNIDGLHQQAGSKRVYELHGSVLRNRCMACGRDYPVSAIADSQGVPRCSCGGIIKPDVVLYEESLSSRVLQGALSDIQQAEMLIIGGTSLVVYPAAGLVNYDRATAWSSSTRPPLPMIKMQTWSSPVPLERFLTRSGYKKLAGQTTCQFFMLSDGGGDGSWQSPWPRRTGRL